MGMESLNTAARAAGFAMAAPDDLLQEGAATAKRYPDPARDTVLLRPLEFTHEFTEEPKVGAKIAQGATEWLRSLAGAFGRRAPA